MALDTEFVLAKQSEVEMKSDGVREVIRPNFHALGRVSIVRGAGEDEGQAFIDDWIHVKEPVVDYLHKHSGISPGDLDPRSSVASDDGNDDGANDADETRQTKRRKIHKETPTPHNQT